MVSESRDVLERAKKYADLADEFRKNARKHADLLVEALDEIDNLLEITEDLKNELEDFLSREECFDCTSTACVLHAPR